VDRELIVAARRGAQSVHVIGWHREECESAALEAICRRRPGSTLAAYRAGRAAAIDELRRLTHVRRLVPEHSVPLGFHDAPVRRDGFDEIDEGDALARWVARLDERERRIVGVLLEGGTGEDCARELGVDPSRIVQLRKRMIDRNPYAA
jgi:hypothetical protein